MKRWLALALVAAPAWAQDAPPDKPRPEQAAPPARPSPLEPQREAAARFRAADPYIGVVSDSTITFIGQEFYRSFVALWREQERAERYSLAVFERPSARWGSLVWIEYANRRVYSAFLSPGRREQVRANAQQAALRVYQALLDADIQRLLFRDADLAADEF